MIALLSKFFFFILATGVCLQQGVSTLVDPPLAVEETFKRHQRNYHQKVAKARLGEDDLNEPVEIFRMDHDHAGRRQRCKERTYHIQKELVRRNDYMKLIEEIQESSFMDNESNAYVLVQDRYVNLAFQHICETSFGRMISADIKLSEEIDYKGYPICLAQYCDKDASHHTAIEIVQQNFHFSLLRSNLEITLLEYQDYSDPEATTPPPQMENGTPEAICLSQSGNTCLVDTKMYLH